ncbi:Stk1 family PASTA domain-containing Ser/Thr kinase [Actinophytocola sp.]|uniref:Stk1 family PASTA domain-containing Ser/Thr kinase n=1 Tax=Actinophytocola sp. TaxID=1872138 RepID=UPI0025BAA55C|nr:Stk1 family PASTA domain-containing Ser/Thr kinase [Actinophytocola sp.]
MDERGARLIGALLEQRYRVDALLARGGMSSVYRGLDTRLDRRVAIKVMDARFADDRTFVDRFEREARSAAKIHHPNVVAVHDQGVDRTVDGNLVYLVMELVDGGTLRDLINERGALDTPLTLSIMEPVLAALAAAHRAGLVHRDVKPENVLIGHGGEHGTAVKVGDFGLVRAVASAGTTSSSIILGTVAYLSPEQVTTGAATARGDVYSAGIVLYEALTGVTPYTGDNPLSIAYRHVNDDVPAPGERLTGLPPALDELVVRATRRDPAARPADGAAFLQELVALRAQLSVPVVPVPVPEPTIQDRTVPVTPVDQARALTPPPTDDPEATSGGLNVADLGQPAMATSNATIVRQAPAGFRAMGPQGTRAMLRTDLDQAQPRPPQPPVMHPNLGSPSVGFPVPPMPPPPRKPSRAQRGMPPPKRSTNIVLWSIVVVLVLALAGTTTWWFASGRWTTVPNVAGQQATKAQTVLRDNDIEADMTHVWDNDVDAGLVVRTEPGAGRDVLRGDKVKLVVSSGPPRVPDIEPGTSVDDAKQAIKDAGLQPGLDDGLNDFSDDVPEGTVLRLDPEGGTQLRLNERVDIVLSKGAEPKPLPDLRNKTKDEAFAELTNLGLQPVEGTAAFDQDIEGGRVIGTDPPAGTVVNGDSQQVTVVLSNAVTVPDVNQKSQQEAEATLRQLGLDVEVQNLGGGGGPVLAQNPPANSRVQPGTKIVIWTVP